MIAASRIVEARADTLTEAADLVRTGRLVVFPTETVYGVGADATNDRAVAAIFLVKERPKFNPVIVHVLDVDAASDVARLNECAKTLAQAFWPGPLSLVLERRNSAALSLLVSAGLDTVAVRAPAHPVARQLLIACALPIAAPSANMAGTVSPTRAEHAATSLGTSVDLVLDGGPCSIGIESTVLDVTGKQPTLLRPGGVTREAIEAEIGPIHISNGTNVLRAPGMQPSHYAPRLPMRLEAVSARAGEALLAFGPDIPSNAARILNLSPTADLAEAAANLFAMLRALDRPRYSSIAVMPIPDHDLGLAINDRLRRAAVRLPTSTG